MKTQIYVLGSVLTAFLALAAVQGCEATEQQGKVVGGASQKEEEPKSRSKDKLKVGSKSSAKPAAPQPPDEITLTKEFREAAMLVKLALEQLDNKQFERESIFTRYQEEADKAKTVASARAISNADRHVELLLGWLFINVEEQHNHRIERTIEENKMKMGGGVSAKGLADLAHILDEVQALETRYLNCASHLEKTLSGAKYIGDGACIHSPEQNTKP